MNPNIRGNQKWFKRNIIIDHSHKNILIQIMWDGDGNLNLQERADIVRGSWHNFVPAYMIANIREALSSGYTITPTVIASDNNTIEEKYHIVQVIDLENERLMFKYDCMQPIEG
jgi:hypothetical protein